MTTRAPWVGRAPGLVLVLAIGVIVRAVLIPITHGRDFVVWELATKATLRGTDIYAHHPHYVHGPFAYFPLFLYIETPFQWLAQHTGIPFVVLGKLPMLAADIACALLIARTLREHGRSPQAVAWWTAAFFLNPLVLYDSAYYGRFDTLGCALLLVATRTLTRRADSADGHVMFALAIAAKTFPGFLVAGVLRRAGKAWGRAVATIAAVLFVLCIPYLGSLRPMLHDIVLYDAKKPPGWLSWQHILLQVMTPHHVKLFGYGLLVVFGIGTILLTQFRDLWTYTALTLVLFLVCSKVVLEQYLIWPMPWLVVLAAARPPRLARPSAILFALFSVIGMLDLESFHPFGRTNDKLNVVLAACCLAYLVGVVASQPRSSVPKVSQASGLPVR